MTYKDWTDAELLERGKRLAELIPQARRDLVKRNPPAKEAIHEINEIHRGEIALELFRKEWKQRHP